GRADDGQIVFRKRSRVLFFDRRPHGRAGSRDPSKRKAFFCGARMDTRIKPAYDVQLVVASLRSKGQIVPRHIVCLTFDFDTMPGFIAGGLPTPTALSRGEFGARASARILALLQSRGIRSTWFTPGFTIETYPRECEAVVQASHEIAHHSWAHVPPAEQPREDEEADMERANEAVLQLTGRKARGYRSPSWDLSPNTIDLLVKHGFVYDSSLMGADYWPYRARRDDLAELGKPYRFGEGSALIEMPI